MTYRLTEAVQFEEIIKKSRFITQAVPLHDSADAAKLITQLSTPNATHNCWAWKVGDEYRFSDDGEPGGTAGRPMLAAIENQNFDHVLAVCTRWYGGINLGTGGLQRAYGNGVNQCLQNAPKKRHIPRQRLQGHCPYSEISLLQTRLAALDVIIEQEDFDAKGATFTIAAPIEQIKNCQKLLQQLSNGAETFSVVLTPSLRA